MVGEASLPTKMSSMPPLDSPVAFLPPCMRKTHTNTVYLPEDSPARFAALLDYVYYLQTMIKYPDFDERHFYRESWFLVQKLSMEAVTNRVMDIVMAVRNVKDFYSGLMYAGTVFRLLEFTMTSLLVEQLAAYFNHYGHSTLCECPKECERCAFFNTGGNEVMELLKFIPVLPPRYECPRHLYWEEPAGREDCEHHTHLEMEPCKPTSRL